MTDLAEYRAGAIDLLGVIACGQLTAFGRLADDARLAPSLADKVELSGMAADQFERFRRVSGRISELGAEAMAAMTPFHSAFDSFHEHTAPNTWLEGLIKAYVGDGIAADFYREVAAFVDPQTRELVIQVLTDAGHTDFLVERVRTAVEESPHVAGRLALWGRRLVGEALSQAQLVATDRKALSSLLTGTIDRPGMDLAAVSRLFSRLAENHTERMKTLGLQA